jgi:cell division protein FtsB
MKITKKNITPLVLLGFIICGIIYLFTQSRVAFEELLHWQTRESVLIKEIEALREESKAHQQFLDRLRRSPDFQDEVARKELGYSKPEEWLFRFPPETN